MLKKPAEIKTYSSVLRPDSLFIRLAIIWAILAVLAPFRFTFDYNLYPLFLIVAVSLAFLLGCRYSPGIYNHNVNVYKLQTWKSGSSFKRLLWFIILIALIGCSLRGYDRLISRGLSDLVNTTDARLLLINQGESLSSTAVIAAAMFPWTYCVFFMGRVGWFRLNIVEKSFVILLSIYPVVDGFLQGGIIGSSTALLFYYFTTKTIKNENASANNIAVNNIVKMIMLSIISIIIGLIFLDRIDSMFTDILEYMDYSEKNGTIFYTKNAYILINNFGSFGFLLIWVIHYFTLGVHELFFLIDNYNYYFFYGKNQAYILFKIIRFLGFYRIGDTSMLDEANPVIGHYQTFWGPAYMDFGWAIIIEALLAGIISIKLYWYAVTDNIFGLTLYPYFQMIIIFGFLANGLDGERLYFLIALSSLSFLINNQLLNIANLV